jgi:putative oxygen-independent coproporphyrinogen III oxidase
MLGIYVHFPFCRVHCSYCAFAVSTDLSLQEGYVEALLREIDGRAGGRVDSIYFGGGTPSRTDRAHLAAVSDRIQERFEVAENAEFSLEANPEDISLEAIDFWRSIGVNRLSVGVQSFHDSELLPLGRVHGADRAREAIGDAVRSGIRTSIDLILGLPLQTRDSFRDSLDEAIAGGVGHVSLYMLDLEEGTSLHRQVSVGRASLPDDEVVADVYLIAVDRLAAAGFEQYEISNFARAGEESRHNLRYWRRGEYHGFGAGAHSFIDGRRFANARDVRQYIEKSQPDFAEVLNEIDVKRETIFLRLRQVAGIDYDEVARLCGQEGIEWMEHGVSEGWLRRSGSRVAFTPSGFLLSNELISQLF